MKPILRILPILAASAMLGGCTGLANFVGNVHTVWASDTLVSQSRAVSGFTAIDMRTFGKVVITQGAVESLTVRGSDNVVPLVTTDVEGGVLVFKTEPDVMVNGMNSTNMLTFTVTVKSLDALTLSGAGDVNMDSLTGSSLDVNVSGAGDLTLGGLSLTSLNLDLSGVGNANLSGTATNATIEISGAGNVYAADLEVATASVSISGLGNATVWVTDSLHGEISGAGNVSYYGTPQLSTSTSGLGRYKSLGNK